MDFSHQPHSDPQSGDTRPTGLGMEHAPAPRSGLRRRLVPLALAGALVGGTVMGGVVGSATTYYLMSQVPAPAIEAPAIATAQQQPIVHQSSTAAVPDLAALYEQVAPAVVSIEVRERGTGAIRSGGEGTGFFVDGDGRLITNYHVVADAGRIDVVLKDGSRYQAQLVGADPGSDVAVLQASVPSEKLVATELGDSSAVRPGDPVFAIGSPFGLDHTITAGIVSALDRSFGLAAGGRPMRGLIQTDAPVNPGNSGGPLFNAQGQVIGITTSINSPVRGSVGIGFAIPSNVAKRLLPDLAKGATIQHPWLGIEGYAVTDQVAAELGLPVRQGILVGAVVPNGPAAQAGLRGGQRPSGAPRFTPPQGGDIIVSIDGQPVTQLGDITRHIETRKVGDTVKLGIFREGSQQELVVTLGPWPTERPN